LESLPGVLMLAFLGGIQFPFYCAICCFVYFFARLIYSVSYPSVSKNANTFRSISFTLSFIVMLALLIFTIWSGVIIFYQPSYGKPAYGHVKSVKKFKKI